MRWNGMSSKYDNAVWEWRFGACKETMTYWWAAFALGFDFLSHNTNSCQFGIYRLDNCSSIFPSSLQWSCLCTNQFQALPGKEASTIFKCAVMTHTEAQMNPSWRHLPGHDFSRNRSASINSQRVCFFSHSWVDETIFQCEHCNRTGLPTHTQDLGGVGDRFRYKQLIKVHILTHSEFVDADWPHCEW